MVQDCPDHPLAHEQTTPVVFDTRLHVAPFSHGLPNEHVLCRSQKVPANSQLQVQLIPSPGMSVQLAPFLQKLAFCAQVCT